MKYEKPMIHVVGDAQLFVLGIKERPPFSETPDVRYLQSIAAYEADELVKRNHAYDTVKNGLLSAKNRGKTERR
jgi:hypothetical protein